MADAPATDQQQANPVQFLDALSQLFGNIPNPNQNTPSPVLRPGMPYAPPNGAVSGTGAAVPYNAPPTAVSPTAVPPAPPSDDKTITMPTLPATPQLRMPDLLNQRLATRAAIEDVNKSHANDARDNKPHWYDRLLGGLTGGLTAAATGNEQLGANLGGRVTNRAFNRVDSERQKQLAPLYRNLEAQKEDESFYKGADESSQRTFEDKRQNAVEERNQITSQQKNEMAQQLNDIKQQMADNKHDEAMSRIQEMQKRLDEKTQHDKDWMEMQGKLLDLKRQALEDKEKSGGKGKQNKFDTIQKDKAAAEARADRDFAKATEGLKPDSSDYKQAAENKTEAYRAAQANYEQRIETQGGDPDHIEYDDSGVARNNAGVAVGPAGGTPPAAQPGQTQTQQAAPNIAKPPKAGAQLTDRSIAQKYLAAAKGDKAKARQLAAADGWKF